MIRVAVIETAEAERAVARHRSFELVDEVDEAEAVVVNPDGEGLALCSLLSARAVPVVVYAPAADDVVLLGAGVAGAAAVVGDPRALYDALRALPVAA